MRDTFIGCGSLVNKYYVVLRYPNKKLNYAKTNFTTVSIYYLKCPNEISKSSVVTERIK